MSNLTTEVSFCQVDTFDVELTEHLARLLGPHLRDNPTDQLLDHWLQILLTHGRPALRGMIWGIRGG